MDRRLNVVEIIAGFSIEKPLGGIERFVVELCRRLDPQQFAVSVFGLWDFGTPYNRRWIASLNEAGIETFEGGRWDETHPYQSFVRSFRLLEQTLLARPVDILHSHDQFGDVMLLLLKHRLPRARLVRTTHNHREWRRSPLRRALLWGLAYPIGYDVEIGLNRVMVDGLNRRLAARLLKKKALLIPNALNLERFQTAGAPPLELKEALGIPRDGLVVGSVGRLTEQKGYGDLLRAAQIVLARDARVTFVLVGSGELEAALKQQAQELGIAERVIFAGPRADIERLIHIFDVFASSSLWEGLPTVVMESMAAGIPVVGTDIPGTRDLITHQVSGLLAPPGDPRALAEQICFALQNPELRAEWAQRARQEVEKHSINRVAAQYEALFLQLAGFRQAQP